MKKILYICVISLICLSSMFFILRQIDKNTKYEIDSKLLESKINKIIVYKTNRTLGIYENNRLIKTYKIALGKNPIGQKHFEGDNKTPEGNYIIDSKNPNSRYFLNLGISYPNAKDKQYAKTHNKSPGGDIKIHGLPNGTNIFHKIFEKYGDWTNGCIALNNKDMYELYYTINIGTKILILP